MSEPENVMTVAEMVAENEKAAQRARLLSRVQRMATNVATLTTLSAQQRATAAESLETADKIDALVSEVLVFSNDDVMDDEKYTEIVKRIHDLTGKAEYGRSPLEPGYGRKK